jgi:hypothetical protein
MPLTTALQYWQKQMLTANPRWPPTVRSSDAEVIESVTKTEGAVGYVSKSPALPPSVRVVTVID